MNTIKATLYGTISAHFSSYFDLNFFFLHYYCILGSSGRCFRVPHTCFFFFLPHLPPCIVYFIVQFLNRHHVMWDELGGCYLFIWSNRKAGRASRAEEDTDTEYKSASLSSWEPSAALEAQLSLLIEASFHSHHLCKQNYGCFSVGCC